MRLLMLSDNYPPEMNANARIFSELAELWAKQNHDVSVITCHPNFPRGKIFQGFTNKWISKSQLNKVTLIRIKSYMAPNHGLIKRTLDFFSFALSSFLFGLFQPKSDVIIGVTPQFFCALSACCLAKIRKLPYVIILCDLWPDAIMESGFISKKLIYKILKKIELWMYHRSNSITILSDHFRKYLHNLGIADKKIITSISGASKKFYPRKKNKNLITLYKLSGKFVIGYIGTFGISHNHEDILAIAELLKKTNNLHIHFFLIGDGPKRDMLAQQTIKRNLDNVTIAGPFPAKLIPNFWSVVDLAIIPLAPIETNKTVLPSKMLEAMASGIPILLYGPDGEARRFLAQSDSGWYIPSGYKKELTELIIKLSGNQQSLIEQKEKVIKFSKKFSREKQAKNLLTHLESIIKTKS